MEKELDAMMEKAKQQPLHHYQDQPNVAQMQEEIRLRRLEVVNSVLDIVVGTVTTVLLVALIVVLFSFLIF